LKRRRDEEIDRAVLAGEVAAGAPARRAARAAYGAAAEESLLAAGPAANRPSEKPVLTGEVKPAAFSYVHRLTRFSLFFYRRASIRGLVA